MASRQSKTNERRSHQSFENGANKEVPPPPPPSPPSRPPLCAFENVGYKNWNISNGRIVLSETGFIYGDPIIENGRKLKVRWSAMTAPPRINQKGAAKPLLKIHARDSSHVFQMQDRADLEQAKEEIVRCIKSTLNASEREAMKDLTERSFLDSSNTPIYVDPLQISSNNDSSETNSLPSVTEHTKNVGNNTTYSDVSHKGLQGGYILLTESAFHYFGPYGNASDDVRLEWKFISKHKINAASQKVPLVRIVSTDHVSYIFRVLDRLVLERIKEDIRTRRVAAASARREERLRSSNQVAQTQGADTTDPSSKSFTDEGPNKRSSPLRKSHGANRKHHESVKPTLGSFARLVGPAADIRELEYVSCLHQNVEFLLRSDGTISSQDIVPYLTSRYGVMITPDQAADIACNLCGGKPRNELSAKRDANRDEMLSGELVLADDDDGHEDEEEIYYFDLVQMMSLLMIPELLQLSQQHGALAASKTGARALSSFTDVTNPVSFLGDEKDSLRLSKNAVGVVQVVIEALIEIFDEDLRNDIRNGLPLDSDSLRTILESFGEVDVANDPQLVQQMLDALPGRVLSVDSFLSAITSDVKTYSTSSGLEENAKATRSTKLSIFHDVFGFNWDNHTRKKDLKEAPKTFASTFSCIDYASDSYRSVLHNTSVWCLFILTTMIYVNFFIKMIQDSTGGLLCPNDKNFGCTVGNKIIGWIITAVFCGFYGLFFILPTSMGNVHGRTLLLLLTLVVTAVFTYAPFSTLIWYRQGVPHHVNITHEHRVVCPAWLNQSEMLEYADETMDTTQYFLYLDDSCLSIIEWCEEHPEVQGKYLDPEPDILTYDEFEKCYKFVTETVVPDSGLWTVTGGACDPDNFNATCPDDGACALRDLNEGSPYVCCHTGTSSFFETDGSFGEVCDTQPPGAPCVSSDMCESFVCENSVCVSGAGAANATWYKELGDSCGRSNSACKSGFCSPNTDRCEPLPTVCPLQFLELLGGFRLDPFCRTVGDWCDINAVDQVLFNLVEVGYQIDAKDTCTAALNGFLKLSEELDITLVKLIDPSEAEIGYTYIFEDTNIVEDVLIDPWAYFILLCIAIVGAFALLSIIRGLALKRDSEDRVRDHSIKSAANFKMANLIENALSMHMVAGASTKGQVMRNFFLSGEEAVEVGGLVWTLKGIWSGSLFTEEGIRYTGRLWIAQVTQVVVAIIGIAYSIEFFKALAREVDEIRKELNDAYTAEEVKQISNVEWPSFTRDDLTVSDAEQAVLDRMPEKWMIEAAGFPAVAIGTLVAIFCILVYVPSYTNTVLKLRSGMIPSLHDPFFRIYRLSADNVVPNIGNMVFSMLGSAAFTGSIVFAIIFVFVWPVTREEVVGFLAVAIGILCTIIIKVVGQKLLRARNFSGFYRKNPLSANVANLFFECWHIGTSLLVVVIRLLMFLIMAALWLGRVDTEFLHPNVKLLGFNVDKLPEAFRKDLLVHEAHGHPFIERLGGLYLLRLRDGDNFGSMAGTHWRSLFVSGLMPWIVKYKVNTNDAGFH